MEGLYNRTSNNAEFVTISNGKFLFPVRNEDGSFKTKVGADGQPILNKNGNPARVYNEIDRIGCKVLAIAGKDDQSQYGQGLTLYLRFSVSGKEYILKEPIIVGDHKRVSGNAETLIMALASIKNFANTEVEINIWKAQRMKDGKAVLNKEGKPVIDTRISLKADGEKVNWAVEPKDRPAMPFNETFDSYDFKARKEFLEQWVTKIQAVLGQGTTSEAEAVAENAASEGPALSETPSDDLPM